MNVNKAYSYARDQLYHLKVQIFSIAREKTPLHPSQQWKHTISVLERVAEEACEAFMAGDILEVVINRYTPIPLPGFEPPSVLERLGGKPTPGEEDGDEPDEFDPQWLDHMLRDDE